MEKLFESIYPVDGGLTPSVFISIVAASLIIGFAISMLYLITNRKEGYSQSYVWTIIMLPPIVAIVI
ncbi:MAG: DUF4956 domain-containing protein, partial [Oscillospiraceae bacterium]|nr:DUF4956 domain-containing protein [Oscillospiraceae bacterium]